jgi:carbonic anhydrase
MRDSYKKLLDNNHLYVAKKIQDDPDFFKHSALSQTPRYLWLGCADSRMPTSLITGTEPGEIFVHRNIANLVSHTDFNFMSVLQYAVQVLEVEHIIVCGHYGCGGVNAAMTHNSLGLINKWIRNIKETYLTHGDELYAISDEEERSNRLVELNVQHQVENIAKTSIVQEAWRKRELYIHGWVYGLKDGVIKELPCTISGLDALHPVFHFS